MIKLPKPAGEVEFAQPQTSYINWYVTPPEHKTKLYTEEQLRQAIHDTLDQTALLFSQDDYVEYRGDEIRATILKLK